MLSKSKNTRKTVPNLYHLGHNTAKNTDKQIIEGQVEFKASFIKTKLVHFKHYVIKVHI